MSRIIVAVLLGVLLSGCAAGNKYQYDREDVDVSVNADSSVAVATLDLRPYVVDNDKTPDFVGLQRAGFGNPFDVLTSSTNPLAHDMTSTVATALNNAGLAAEGVYVPAGSPADSVKQQLFSQDASHYLLLVVHQWKSDTYMSTTLPHDLTVTVYGPNKKQLGQKTLVGNDNLGTLGAMPSDIGEGVSLRYKLKLEELLNSPEIVNALEKTYKEARGRLGPGTPVRLELQVGLTS